jgi:N-glycosylase/DNA lyase
MKNLIDLYKKIKPQIEDRLNEFSDVWRNGTDEDIFAELVYCLLTPQSKAHYCMIAVENLVKKNCF